jgi:hypothetical protein
MASIKPDYIASSAVTITLASLASSTTFLAGRESTAIDNTTNEYADYHLAGKITTGTAPTAGRIEVYVVGMLDDATWPDVFDGTDSAETITDVNIKNSICRLAAAIVTGTTANQAYSFGPVSVAATFGMQVVPKKFVVYIAHSTVAALNATGGNHVISVAPHGYTSA